MLTEAWPTIAKWTRRGRSFAKVKGRLLDDPRDGLVIDSETSARFLSSDGLRDIVVPPKPIKVFERIEGRDFGHIVFAIPDRHELLTMSEGPF